ncbi:hypothetical protein ACOMHN_059927 [Nucella lapillus]
MSKVSFRARALDVSKPMPIYRDVEIPDMHDYDKINRAVVQMPTGMEKEEEMETHLQKALTAQQFYGTAEVRTIPIPEVQAVDDRYGHLYKADYKTPKQYIHVEALGMEHEIPDYDLDSEDESWLQEQTKKMEISSSKFEEMMDRLEKGSGQQVVTLPEAKLLLKEDDDLIIAVYDYWLNKRLRLEMPLIPQVKSEKRDGTTTNNPYVAFRRRTEKMQTRKNRKNDEVSYEKMLKLKRDMLKSLTLTQFLKRREKSKKEILQLTLEVMEKRYQMTDFNGTMLAEAEAERAKMPSFIPPFMFNNQGHAVATYNGEEVAPVRKKRQYRRRQKQPQQPRTPHSMAAALATAASFADLGMLHPDLDSSEEDLMSPALSPSDHEDEHDPDGPFAFKRRKTCHYFSPLYDRCGTWSWSDPQEGGKGDRRHRFSLTSLSDGHCIGFARRRVGRGGRVVLDRGYTPWDDGLEKLNLTSGQSYSGVLGDYITHIRERKIPHYRPKSPPPDESSSQDGAHPSLHSGANPGRTPSPGRPEFNAESYRSHHEQLMAMHMEQEAVRLNQDTAATLSSALPLGGDLGLSFSSQPTSQFTLDSASAQFAASAVIDVAQLAKTADVESVNHKHVGAAGDAGLTQRAVSVSEPAPPPPPGSSSLLSTVPSSSSSSTSSLVVSSPVVLSSLPAIMAPKSTTVGLSIVPSTCTVTPKTVLAASSGAVSLSALSFPASAVSVMAQATGRRQTNGPLVTTASLIRGRTVGSSAAATIVQLPQHVGAAPALRAVVPVPTPNPIVTASATSIVTGSAPGSMGTSVGTGGGTGGVAMTKLKAANKVMLVSGVGASSTMCSMASSPLAILKSGQEEGKNAMHLFAADTPMPMDVS